MKKIIKAINLISLLSLVIISCNKENPLGKKDTTTNQSPDCIITSPKNGDTFMQGNIIPIMVNSEDPDGYISKITFRIDNQELEMPDIAPYSFNLNTSKYNAGTHIVFATAYDNESGASTDSIEINLLDSTQFFLDTRDSQIYKIVKIGNQIWMAENLNFNHPSSLIYNNDTANEITYGRLYNWQTACEACPEGWHLPSESEWVELRDFFGGKYIAGNKLKEAGSEHWMEPNNGTNESGFTGLPGGWYISHFWNIERYGYWWSSTEWNQSSSSAISFYLSYGNSGFIDYPHDKRALFSVRCIKTI